MADRLIDLLRHGEVQGGGRFRGSHDDPLAEQGWTQMRAVTDADAADGRAGWNRILHSPALRCAAFAQELAARRGLPSAPMPDFRERVRQGWHQLLAGDHANPLLVTQPCFTGFQCT